METVALREPPTPVWDRIPLYGEYTPPEPEFREILTKWEPDEREVNDLAQRIVEDWIAYKFYIDVLSAQLGEVFTDWQVNKIYLGIDPGVLEMLDARNRGGSKTRDNIIIAISVCAAEPETQGMWLAGNTFQLREALRYANAIQQRTFMGKLFKITTDKTTKAKTLSFKNGSFLVFNASTATSGPRTNYLHFDEEGKITEKHKIENNRNAMGMITGAKGIKRIRHCTTLSIGTPAQDVYERLLPENLVYINYPEDCYWWTEGDWSLLDSYKLTKPRWWLNCEYYSKLDAPGGRIFTHQHPLSIFDLPCTSPVHLGMGSVLEFTRPHNAEKCTRTINQHWLARGGTDWNPAMGHTVTVAITDSTDWFVVDEYAGVNLKQMAQFILRWQNHPFWGNKWHYTAEQQGHLRSTQSRAETLRQLGVEIHEEENFNTADQIAKLSFLEGLNENGCLHFASYCAVTIKQSKNYRRDPRTGTPAQNQDDHNVDGLMHLANPPDTTRMEKTSDFAKW